MIDAFAPAPKAKLLLTPELRKKTEARIEWCMKIAKLKWPHLDFPMPEIYYDVKNTDGGLAYFNQWMIRLNIILFAENEEHFLATTVAHEAAHLITDRVFGRTFTDAEGKIKKVRAHGKEWRSVMVLLEVPAKRCHSYDITTVQRPKKKRSKVGSLIGLLIDGGGIDLGAVMIMHRRLQNGVKRLTFEEKLEFQSWLNSHILEQPESEE